jgi:hypothetical protein
MTIDMLYVNSKVGHRGGLVVLLKHINQARPGHMCRGIGPPKNEDLNFFFYNSNIIELKDVKLIYYIKLQMPNC